MAGRAWQDADDVPTLAFEGEHWACAYCEKQNRGKVRVCKFCGADQTLKEKVKPRTDDRAGTETPVPKPKKRQGRAKAA